MAPGPSLAGSNSPIRRRCKQILNNEIENLEIIPDHEDERKDEIKVHRDAIELMDKLLSHISHKHPDRKN